MARTGVVWFTVFVLLCGLSMGTASGTVVYDTPTAECAFPNELTDAHGETVTLEEKPNRIVALTPTDAQILWSLGARDRVVGMPVSEYTEFLDDHDSSEDITGADGLTVNIELVIGLEPDVILAGNVTERAVVDNLRDADQTVYHFETAESIEDVMDSITVTGQLIGSCDAADETTTWMSNELERIETSIDSAERPLVYYEMGDGWTAGSGTFQHEILTTAGAENLGERVGIEGWAQVSDEVVVDEDPEWIVYGHMFDEPPVSVAIEETTALQQNNVVQINSNFVSQPGPYVIYAIAELTAAFHPDQYDLEDLTMPGSDHVDDEPDASWIPQPGFGFVVALIAILLSSIAAHRLASEGL